MKIQYWGTGAAEGIPAIFCNCEVCKTAREEKGRHIRTRSQCLIDGELLIDFGPDTFMHALHYNVSLGDISSVLITHTHEDHFYPEELNCRQEFFCYDMASPALHVYGSAEMVGEITARAAKNDWKFLDQKRVVLYELKPFMPYAAGSFTVTPLPAAHGTGQPFVYLIERGGQRILYLHDSGYLKEEVLAYLKDLGGKLDLVSYDCTHADLDMYRDLHGDYASIRHMGLPDNVRVRDALIEAGLFCDDTLNVASHFSHNGNHVSYDVFKKIAEKQGFIPAYDGMEIDL